MNILVINGPNLNLLGERHPEIYGKETLDDLMNWLKNTSEGLNQDFKFYQSNHEGNIIDCIHKNRQWSDGIILNAGAFTHYSYAIRDAIEAVGVDTIEVHISDIKNREEFRKKSVLEDVCLDQIYGMGKLSYLEGLKMLLNKEL